MTSGTTLGRTGALLAITLLASGCSSSDAGDPCAGVNCPANTQCRAGTCVAAGEPCPAPGASECAGDGVRRCEGTSGASVWSDVTPCGKGLQCSGGQCLPPTPTPVQQAQIDTVDEYIGLVQHHSGWVDDVSVDVNALRDEVRATILLGDGSAPHLYRALRLALLAFPIGHHGLRAEPSVCATPKMFSQALSRYGACARPSGDAMVISHAKAGNALGFSVGDLIVAVDGRSGDDMFAEALLYPVCGSSSPAPHHARMAAATSLLGAVPVGSVLDVKRADGSTTQMTAVEAPIDQLPCVDPLGRNTNFDASSRIRGDGVAVIRLPRFYSLSADPNAPYQVQFDQMVAAIKAEFDKVSHAPAIIWDARANGGGMSPVAFSIVGGMPGAKQTHIARCGYRLEGTSPVQLATGSVGDFVVTPGGPFTYSGKVAVLSDAFAGSAGDYFVRAVDLATNVPIVGTPSMGAFGGVKAGIQFGAAKEFTATLDPYRCADDKDVALEGRPSEPDVFVELDPKDLAKGIDTQEEAAAQLLLD